MNSMENPVEKNVEKDYGKPLEKMWKNYGKHLDEHE